MDGFALLLGHLVGDYILQNDWMAKNKTNQHPGQEPFPGRIWLSTSMDESGNPIPDLTVHADADLERQREWWRASDSWWRGHLACTIHCLLYTLAVWLMSFAWMPWWGLAVCFAVHWPIDRFRLARKWMESVSGQREFANGVFSPWSIIVVDNIFHLLTLFVIAAAAGKVG